MINHTWSILCESASIDNETNKLSIFNILDGLTIFREPEQVQGIPIKFEVISCWERSEEDPCEGMMRVFQRKPSGEKSEYFPLQIDLTHSRIHRTRVKFKGMLLSGSGRYAFVVEYKEGDGKWKKAAELPILINFEAKKNG